MKRYSNNQKIRFNVIIIAILGLTLFQPQSTLNASDNLLPINNTSLAVAEIPDADTGKYFSLVEARIIDADPLGDQMLEEMSPALVVPEVKKVSPLKLRQKLLAEYNQSVCFKRCHSTNDFSVSDFTYKQWCQLIEKDGHTIFSEIPWGNAEEKEKLIQYLSQNAKTTLFESAGIGKWD